MSDLEQRLRKRASRYAIEAPLSDDDWYDIREAADRLRQYREALEAWAAYDSNDDTDGVGMMLAYNHALTLTQKALGDT